jgi:hypothetical protein
MAKQKKSSSIDSVMTGVPPVPGLASAPGIYNRHRDVGPDGVDGGFPTKFYDDAVKATPGPVDTDMPKVMGKK